MKATIAVLALVALTCKSADAFTPSAFTRSVYRSSATKQSALFDPSIFQDAHQHVDAFQSIFSSITLSDATDALTDAVTAAPAAVQDVAAAAAPVADAAAPAASSGNGGLAFLEGPIEFLLQVIHSALVSVGVSENSWGVSIVAMVLSIKLLTYPLTATQIKSTANLQVLQPTIKEIQAKYQSNPEVMNQKIAEFYQTNEINPLSGCLPALIQLPVFLGLYRAVLTLAKDNKLNEPFLWLPNLEGPTYGADPTHANDWLFKGWVDGTPSLGWEDTIAFLILPLSLIVLQAASTSIMSPKDQEQPAFLKFLPVMFGYFALTVPAALSVYWVINTVVTTALTLFIKSGIDDTPAVAAPGGTSASSPSSSVIDIEPTTFTPAPMREKPAGFASTTWDEDGVDSEGVKAITPTDAEIESKDEVSGSESAPTKKRGGGKKKKKRKN